MNDALRQIAGPVPAFLRKDLIFVRWYAGIVWAILFATQFARVAALLGLPQPYGIARSYALGFALTVGFFGVLACVTLDCPWSPRAFSRGKPVSGAAIHLAKLGALIATFGLPLAFMPVPDGGLVGQSGMAVATYLALFLISILAAVHFERPVFALLFQGLVGYLFTIVVRHRIVPYPRWESASALLIGDAWLAAGLTWVVTRKTRPLALAATALVLGIFAASLFTIRRY